MATVDRITFTEAVLLLGCSTSQVLRYARDGRLVGRYDPRHRRSEHRWSSREAAEKLACEVYDWRRHADDPEPYWVTRKASRRHRTTTEEARPLSKPSLPEAWKRSDISPHSPWHRRHRQRQRLGLLAHFMYEGYTRAHAEYGVAKAGL